MKKLFFTLLALCLCGTMWANSDNDQTEWNDDDRTEAGTVYQDSSSGLYFYVTGDGDDAIANLTWSDTSNNYQGVTTLTIPESVSDGTTSYPVTRIGSWAFHNAPFEGEVTIPANILNTAISIFNGCTGITTVTYEYNATHLKDENGGQNSGASGIAFTGCTNITTVNLYRDINISSSSRHVAPFDYLTSIKTIVIGEHVTEIPMYMFRPGNATNSYVTSVTCYAEYPPTYGTQAFGTTVPNATLYVPETSIGYYQEDSDWNTAFANKIEAIPGYVVPEPEQPEGTLRDVTTKLYFEIDSNGVVSIVAEANGGTYTEDNLVVYSEDEEGNPTAYTLPSYVEDKDGQTGYVTRIGAGAFEHSHITGHLVIPDFINAVATRAFYGSSLISEVTYEYSPEALKDENNAATADYSFGECTGITKVNVYRDITAGHNSNICTPFCYFTTIQEINIGPRVTELPHHIFCANGAKVLKTVNCYAAVPPTLGNTTFRSDSFSSEGCYVNVPQGSLSAYQGDTGTYGWATFSFTGFNEMSNAYAVEISLNNTDGYYATYYNSNAVDIYPPGGTLTDGTAYDVTTYAASGVDVGGDDAYIVLSEVGATVPADVAVLVEATAGGTYTVIETTAAQSASYTGTNNLYGYDTATEISNPSGNYYYYTLSTYDNVLGFWWYNEDGSAFTSAAHKAYLALPQGTLNGTSGIKLKKGDGDDTTGISSVEVENETATVKGIYTLQGVRVNDMNQKGVYIVDGRKVLVK